MDRLLVAWQDAVFELYLAEEKIEPAVVENMRSWPHSGFSVDQSVYLPAGDQAGIERLVQYMTRCPFSLSRLVKVSDTGQVIYQAEKQAYRAFPDPKGDDTRAGVPRNFPVSQQFAQVRRRNAVAGTVSREGKRARWQALCPSNLRKLENAGRELPH